jgi:hypothetical protein
LRHALAQLDDVSRLQREWSAREETLTVHESAVHGRAVGDGDLATLRLPSTPNTQLGVSTRDDWAVEEGIVRCFLEILDL